MVDVVDDSTALLVPGVVVVEVAAIVETVSPTMAAVRLLYARMNVPFTTSSSPLSIMDIHEPHLWIRAVNKLLLFRGLAEHKTAHSGWQKCVWAKQSAPWSLECTNEIESKRN